MPFIHITLGKPVSPAIKQQIGRQTTNLIVDLLGKRHEVTAVLVDVAKAGEWYIGGELQTGDAGTPAHCEIAITAGTNTEDEKSQMIAAMHALLNETLASTPEASYVIINELPASNWGYAGKTQAMRRLTTSTL